MNSKLLHFLIILFSSFNLLAQMYGSEMKLKKDQQMLFLRPSVRCIETGDDHISYFNEDLTEDLLQMVAYVAKLSFEGVASLERFPTTKENDSIRSESMRTINLLVYRRKTIKGIHVPDELKQIMGQTKCNYAFLVVGDLWIRSKKNLKQINSRKKPVESDWVEITYPISYMSWMVFDLQEDKLILWNLEKAMPVNEEAMRKQFRKLLKESFRAPIH